MHYSFKQVKDMFRCYEEWNARNEYLKAELNRLLTSSLQSPKIDQEIRGGSKPTMVDQIETRDKLQEEINELSHKLYIFEQVLIILTAREKDIMLKSYGKEAKYYKETYLSDLFGVSTRSLTREKERIFKKIFELLDY